MELHTEFNEPFYISALYSAFAATRAADFYGKGEAHDFWEIVIVTEGELGATAGKDVFYLKKGQAILHTPGEFHNLWSERDKSVSFIIFSFSANNLPLPQSKVMQLTDMQLPQELLDGIAENFTRKTIWVTGIREGCEARAALTVKRLELFLLELLQGEEKPRTDRTPQSAKHYASVVRFLEENLSLPLTVPQIAEACGLGEVNLKKIFSRYAGTGVMSYFNHLKVRAAVEMLERGATVREVSEALGFLSQNYFCTVFTRIMGKSPKNFKG